MDAWAWAKGGEILRARAKSNLLKHPRVSAFFMASQPITANKNCNRQLSW
jgi:hypothetical protein